VQEKVARTCAAAGQDGSEAVDDVEGGTEELVDLDLREAGGLVTTQVAARDRVLATSPEDPRTCNEVIDAGPVFV
jgi:hypothetical protein